MQGKAGQDSGKCIRGERCRGKQDRTVESVSEVNDAGQDRTGHQKVIRVHIINPSAHDVCDVMCERQGTKATPQDLILTLMTPILP
ncbi:hypothetical protein Pmani_015765 [Petrolisthes manimaculis]|uniref:Uncharacterized protein n=1 Tax=Petrolisthes manimaculis TaxID=1843537 RepID=A0AAE1PQC9_9EUCA|nr:hypothetical protein Pmani_015765 [Petrolisthes manimaculis]